MVSCEFKRYIMINKEDYEKAKEIVKQYEQEQLTIPNVSKSFCNNCKSGLIDYAEINRRTCSCGALGYNVC